MTHPKTRLASYKAQIARLILTDDLDEAKRTLQKAPEDFNLMRGLMEKVQAQTRPLDSYRNSGPKYAISSVSYTCGVGCEMCWAGFHDKTKLFDNYKNLLPEEFDDWMPWVEYADMVMLAGLGETLDSPYIFDHLNKLRNKTTYLTTSGSTLTLKKGKQLIESGLSYLSLSFDGETVAGHGSGDKEYTRRFWENITQLNTLKDQLASSSPILRMQIALNLENLDQLHSLIEKAVAHNIKSVEFFFMIPSSGELFEKSIFSDYENSREQIKKVLSYWSSEGLDISIFNRKDISEKPTSCHYIDLTAIFNLDRYLPQPCCGPLRLPLETRGLTPERYWNSFPLRYFRYLHANDEKERVPSLCDFCWARNPDKFANSIQESFAPEKNSENLIPVYQKASNLKKRNEFDPAIQQFEYVIKTTQDSDLLGKAHFHIGEIELGQGRFENAFSHFQKAIHFQFRHQLAFCYFYLLWIILDKNNRVLSPELRKLT